MIAKGCTIEHGYAALNYAFSKDKSVVLGGQHLVGTTPDDWLMEMKIVSECNTRVKRKFLRFEISPSTKESRILQDKDWKDLAAAFVKEMGLINHQSVCILHQDGKHKHIHIITNRVSLDGEVYKDKFIGKKAGQTAKKISDAVKWEDVNKISKSNRVACWNAICETLKEMNSYSWEKYKIGMKSRGYTITENYNSNGKLNGYNILFPGQTMTPGFKGMPASKLNRNCTIGNIRKLWWKHHKELQIAQLARNIAAWYASNNKGTVTEANLIKRTDGWALRAKVSGLQQLGETVDAYYAKIINTLTDYDRVLLVDSIQNEFNRINDLDIQWQRLGYDESININSDEHEQIERPGSLIGTTASAGWIDAKKKKKR